MSDNLICLVHGHTYYRKDMPSVACTVCGISLCDFISCLRPRIKGQLYCEGAYCPDKRKKGIPDD